jgi:uncharacterized protein (DUF1697 family)
MPQVVLLRGVNVGRANRCQPALIAKQLSRFGLVNIGAVGTFVIEKDVNESTLRGAITNKLPFKCEIIIVPARDIIELAATNPFAKAPAGEHITRFVTVLAKRPHARARIPRRMPAYGDWLLKIIAIRNRFVVGVYRREMKAISYLGKIEKFLATPATTRSWSTIEKIMKLLLTIDRQ